MRMSANHLIETRADFHAALRDAFADVASEGPRELWMCDEDFADWPLNEPDVIDHLSRWAVGHRKCIVLALNYDQLQRRHPRWVQWRRQRSHVVQCRVPDESDWAHMPCMLLAPGTLTMRLVDRPSYRGSVSIEHADAVRGRDLLDAVMQRSVDVFPASTLGL